MRRRTWFLSAVVVMLAALSAWQVALRSGAPFPRYGVIWEGRLTRSGMPDDENAWRWLRARGVEGVVNFRQDNDVEYGRFGISHVLWLPLKGGEPPTTAEAERFLAFVQEPANGRVHIHCAEGKSRTGVMAALARYAIDGWPLERALNEARTYRNGEDLVPSHVQFLEAWAARHRPGSHRRSGTRPVS
jgi:hypothetical protein